MRIKSTNAAVGALVEEIDLSRALDKEAVAQLREAFFNNGLMIFRDQALSEDDQVRFASYFCTPVAHPANERNRGGRAEITLISNTDGGALGNAEVHFHADLAFLHKPGTVSALYCLETPIGSGDTFWTGNVAAYEALDEAMKQRLEALRIVCYHDRPDYNPPDPPRHPVVIAHPESGRKSLYFSVNHARRVAGVPEAEGRELIGFLTRHVTDARFVYRHAWRPGDLAMWDNRLTMHRRDGFDNALRRVMKRTQAVGALSR